MPCHCFGNKSGKQKDKSSTQPDTAEELELTSFPIQIGNNEMKKWESSDKAENDTIRLVDNDVGPQFWQLERADDDLLWSFHISAGDEKLYLTYNDGDPNDQNVKMNFVSDADETKNKYFVASDTIGGKTYLSSRSSNERYLGIKDGILCMIGAVEEFTENMEWIIAIDLEKPSKTRVSPIREHDAPTICWKSTDSEVMDRIQFGDDVDQLWHIEHKDISRCRMKTFNQPQNFASQKPKTDAEIIFGDSLVASSPLTEYKKVHVKGRRSVFRFHLQNQSSGWFVGKQQNPESPFQLLEMKQQVSSATVWTFRTSNFVFFRRDGKTVIFPFITEK